MNNTPFYFVLVFTLFVSTLSFAQSVSLPQATLSNVPMGTVENKGTAIGSIIFVEASGANVPATANGLPNVTITINFQYVALTDSDLNFASGPLLEYFTPTYNEDTNILLLEQSNIIPGDWNGNLDFSIDAIQNSTQEESLNGFSAIIDAVDEGTNAEGDTSVYTYTDESVLQVDIEDIYTVSISPNPTKGLIDINFGDTAITKIEVFDSRGRLLLNQKNSGGDSLSTLDLSSFPNAIYMLKMSSKEAVYLKKVIKK